MPPEDLADIVVLDAIAEAVAAEQQLVSAFQPERERLHSGRPALPRAERAGDDVLVLVGARFLGSYLADFDQPLHQRMILGDLAERRVFHHIRAAVADPRYPRIV